MTESLFYKKITELSEISSSGLEALIKSSSQKHLMKGEDLLRYGQICNYIFFVESGFLRLYRIKNGVEINIDFIFENKFVTNLKSLRSSTPSDVVIQAIEETVIYLFPKDKLLYLYNEFPEIESFGRKLLEQLLIEQEDHTNLFKIFSPKERYSYLQKNRPEILQRITISDLASYLAVSRETISRIRNTKS